MRKTVILIMTMIFHAVLVSPLLAQQSDIYHITADIDLEAKQINAQQNIVFYNRTRDTLTDVYFHIYPNRYYTKKEQALLFRYAGYFKVNPYPQGFEQGSLVVKNVTVGGQRAAAVIQGKDKTLLKVALPQPVGAGEKVPLSLSFSVKIPDAYGRFGWHDNILKAAYWYPILCAQTDKGWDKSPFYPFHRPFFSDAAHYDVTLMLPADYTLAYSGSLFKKESVGQRIQWQLKTDNPVRAFSFAASPDFHVVTEKHNDVDVRVFYLSGDEKRAKDALVNAKSALDYYAQVFGVDYPDKQFSVVPVHLGYGGEQMADMIFLDTRAFKLPSLLDRHFDLLIAHETAHQWIYNMVGVDTFRQMWLEEGFAAYLALDYIEDRYGFDADVLTFPDWFSSYEWILPKASFRRLRDYRYKVGCREGYDGPLVGALDSYAEPSLIFALVYGKGVRVVESLKARVGEEAFKKVLKEAVRRYQYQNWSVDDLRRLCEEASGQDLKEFFKQWLYTDDYADYAVAAVKGRSLHLKNFGKAKGHVNVDVVFNDGSRHTFVWDDRRQAGDKLFDKDIVKVEIDTEQKVLDQDRVNNFWPRRTTVKPVPLYMLYDDPLFLPEDSYNVVFGPEISEGLGLKVSWQKPYDHIVYGATDYELGDEIWSSRAGYQMKHVFSSPMDLGFEVHNQIDLDGGEEDLVSTKVYLRRDLWPVKYGMTDVLDHFTVYLIRNQRLNEYDEGLAGQEDVRNIEYKRNRETIFGAEYYINRSGPYPDPVQGFRLMLFGENAGHMLGAGDYFYRAGTDAVGYIPLPHESKLVLRSKMGLGYPDDKDLFQLGGIDGLRGYGRKELRGANAALGVVEYRTPLIRDLGYSLGDNIIRFNRLDGVVFGEAGRTWFSSYDEGEWKKDIGLGLRFHIDVLGFLEKTIVQLDVAQAVDDSDEDSHVWIRFGGKF